MVLLQAATFPSGSVVLILFFILFVAYLERIRKIRLLEDEINQIHLEKRLLQKKIVELNSEHRHSTTHVDNLDLLHMDTRRRLDGFQEIDLSNSGVPDTARKIAALKAYHEGTGVI